MANKNFVVKNGLEVGGQEVISSSGAVTSAALGGQTLSSTDSPTFNNLTLTNDIAIGGDLNLTGDLNITGDINSLSVTDLDVTDQTITLGVGQVESASGGSGIVVAGSNASLLWDESSDLWDFNKGLDVVGNINASGNLIIGAADSNNSSLSLTANTGNWTFTNVQASRNLEISDSDGTGTVLTIDTSGKVGIGTAPNYPLEVAGPGTVTFAYQRTGVSGPKKWGFHSDSSNTYWQNITDGTLALTVSNDGKIGTGGNLGPQSALHLEHTTDAHGIIVDHKTVGGFSDILFRTKNNAGNQIAMSRIRSDMIDGSTGLEDGEFTIFNTNDGNEKVGLVISRSGSTYINAFTTYADYSDTGASSNYFELGTWNSGQSGRITIRINGANSYSNGFDPAGETVIHGTITNAPDFEGFFYGVTSYGTISNVAVKQNGNDYTIYVLPGTYASYEAHVTITHDSKWTPNHAGADTGSTSAPPGSVQLQSLFSVSTGGQRRLTITSGGSIGIGNTGPTALLHLGNSAMTTNPVGIGIQNNTRYYALEVNSSALRIKDVSAGGIERLRLTSGGKLAIGDIATSGDPNRYLSVYSPSTQSSGFNDVVEFLAPSQTGGGVSVNFGVANSTKNVGKVVFNYGSSGSDNNNIGLGFYDADNLMIIKANGNVGIGSQNPLAKLDITGNNTNIAFTYGNTVPNNPLHTAYYGGWSGIGMDQTTAGIRLAGEYNNNNNPIVDVGYYTSGSISHANWVSRMKISSSGDVLIGGTTHRGRKVVVEGTGDLLQLYSTNTGAGGAQLDLTQDSSSKANGDLVGRVLFSTEVRQYASVHGVAADHSSGAGELHLGVRESSSVYQAEAAVLSSNGRFSSTGYANNQVVRYNITGSFTQNTWYVLTDRAALGTLGFGDGVYQVECYASTFHAGISLYDTHRVYENFYFRNTASNGASTHEFRQGPSFGHAVNAGHDAIGLRYRETYGGANGGPLLEWSPKAGGLTGLNNTAGYYLYFNIRRVG